MKVSIILDCQLKRTLGEISQIAASCLLLCLVGIPQVVAVPAETSETSRERVFSSNTGNLPPNTPYILGPGDRVRIDIFQVEEYSGEYLILVDGTVNLPLIGAILVEGLTISQANQLLTKEYAPFLKRPIITVGIVTPRPMRIAVAGEVNFPGTYEIRLDQEQQFPSVTDIIQVAGGISAAADIHRVQIRRNVGGLEQVFTVDLWDLVKTGNITQDVNLRGGDSILIPAQEKIDPNETRQLTEINFGIQAVQPITITVVGEVNRPGSYTIRPEERTRNIVSQELQSPRPPTLTRAIGEAGGIKALTADLRNVKLRRLTKTGPEQIIDVDLWNLLKTGNVNQDLPLQQGDTVIVPKAEKLDPAESETIGDASFAPDTISVNVIGEVKQPGIKQVDPNTTLNEALQAAGIFDWERAHSRSVDLIRLNQDGTVSKRTIELNFADNLNRDTNPALRNNDVVLVKRAGITVFTDGVQMVLGPLLQPILTIRAIFD
ncbi:MAG: SLBB domain-containing protein [Prochloraceae cyanobacterium]|nr:SLBB domain-containing protein [Prochloraceae cyanobacterium]